MFAKRPKTPDDIRQEIAELARRRDILLTHAPKHVFFGRLVMPLILVPALMGCAARLAGGRSPLMSTVILLVFCVVAAAACYRLWRPGRSPGDLWAASDRVGYEGDSPRDLQRRIEALEASLREGRS